MVRQRSAKPSFAGSIPAVASNSFTLPLPSDFSFESTVVSHGWYLLAPFRWSRAEKVLRRTEEMRGEAIDLEISARGDQLSVTGIGLEPDLLVPRLTRMLQLDVDTSGFISHALASPDHAWVAEARFGRLLCGTTLFEDAVKIIATTNTTWRQTMRMVELLVKKCGLRSPQGNAAFPRPQDVLRFDPEELQRDCRLGYRAKSIHALATLWHSERSEKSGGARGCVSRPPDPSLTLGMSSQELFNHYQRLPGIGPYGAAHLLAMDGRHDFIAVDTEFRRFVRERYHRGRAVGDRTLLKRYERWGRWKYLAYWSELWKSVADALQPYETDK